MPAHAIVELPQADLSRLAHSLARGFTHNDADIDDLVQEALWSFERRLRAMRTPPNNPWAFAKTSMSRIMMCYINGDTRHTGARHNPRPMVDIDYAGVQTDPWDQLIAELDLERYLNQLEVNCGPTARRVAENLLEPCDPCYCEALMASNQKKMRQKRRGQSVRGVHKIRVSHKELRQALGLERKQWHEVLQQVRTFTTGWLSWTSTQPAPQSART